VSTHVVPHFLCCQPDFKLYDFHPRGHHHPAVNGQAYNHQLLIHEHLGRIASALLPFLYLTIFGSFIEHLIEPCCG